MLPLNIEIYINTGLSNDADLELPIADIFITLLSIIVPVTLGMLLRRRTWTCGPGRLHAPLYVWVTKGGSVVGIVFFVAAAVAGMTTYPDLLNARKYPGEWGLAALFQPLGCFIGWVMAKAASLHDSDLRAVALETGVQNYPLILALISLSFKAGSCEWEEISRFVLISMFWYTISSVWLVALMRLTARREGGRTTNKEGGKTDAAISMGPEQAI